MTEKREVTKAAPRATVTPEAVETAIKIREAGGKWTEVIEKTGFNGAILRPHMKRAGFDAEQKAVKGAATPKGIAKDRSNGVPWYAICRTHGLTEAEARKRARAGGCDEEWIVGRKYLRADGVTPTKNRKNGQTEAGREKQAKARATKSANVGGTPSSRRKDRQAASAK